MAESKIGVDSNDASFLEAAARASSFLGLPAYEEWQSMKDDGAASLQQLTDRHSLQPLSSAVQGEQATATFSLWWNPCTSIYP
jgi:hypothetical protein